MAATMQDEPARDRARGGGEGQGSGGRHGASLRRKDGRRDGVRVWRNARHVQQAGFVPDSPLPTGGRAVTMSPSRSGYRPGLLPLTRLGVTPHAPLPPRASPFALLRARSVPAATRPTTPTTSSSPTTGRAGPTSGSSTQGPHHRRRDQGGPEVQHLPLHQEEVRRLRAVVQGAAQATASATAACRSAASSTDEKKFVVRGPQVDVGKGYWGSLYGEGVGGMMKASDPARIKKAVKETEFNDYYILAKGKHITIKINGETMVDHDFPTLPARRTRPRRQGAGPDRGHHRRSRSTPATRRCGSSSRTSSSRT